MTAAEHSGARPRAHRTVTTGPVKGGHPQPRHVWVTVNGITADEHPGIILDWRRAGTGWEALVFWAAGGGRHAAHGRLDWLAAHHVAPR